jgi:hypothetical protein
MIKVDGIILVLSCQKHLNTRLKAFRLPKDKYKEWKVIYVIGDLFLDSDYKMNENFMIIKCEDSYIHLLKKFVLALKYVYELYDIKEGVLRSGDDLLFNENMLYSFLELNKYDFMGKSPAGKGLSEKDITPELLKRTRYDDFMVEYYSTHQEDFDNPHHNLKGVDISKYIERPEIKIGPAGVLYYISNKCCKLLIDHMENIKYDIFYFDEFSKSYPYTIEDVAVSYILYFYKIGFIHIDNMYTERLSNNAIAYHTNAYKY